MGAGSPHLFGTLSGLWFTFFLLVLSSDLDHPFSVVLSVGVIHPITMVLFPLLVHFPPLVVVHPFELVLSLGMVHPLVMVLPVKLAHSFPLELSTGLVGATSCLLFHAIVSR